MEYEWLVNSWCMLMSYAQVRADESALEEVVDPIEAVYALLTSHGVKARIFAHAQPGLVFRNP